MTTLIIIWTLVGFSVGRATATRQAEIHLVKPDGRVEVRVAPSVFYNKRLQREAGVEIEQQEEGR